MSYMYIYIYIIYIYIYTYNIYMSYMCILNICHNVYVIYVYYIVYIYIYYIYERSMARQIRKSKGSHVCTHVMITCSTFVGSPSPKRQIFWLPPLQQVQIRSTTYSGWEPVSSQPQTVGNLDDFAKIYFCREHLAQLHKVSALCSAAR